MTFDYRTFTCPTCGKEFPADYHVKNPGSTVRRIGQANKIYGTRQLMKLWAWHNFERHTKICAERLKEKG